MNDLSIVYYTSNVMPETTAQRVRDHLLKVTGGKYPIISVSQKPIDLGQNICVGPIGVSKYNCYKQIFIGVQEVKTKYVACAEDDTLYSADHFDYRPEAGVFAFNNHMWFSEGRASYFRLDRKNRGGMFGCIAQTKTLLDNLAARFKIYPTEDSNAVVWGEPGLVDKRFGIESQSEIFESETPIVVFRHRQSMSGWKNPAHYEPRKPENITYNLQPHGGNRKLWHYYWS